MDRLATRGFTLVELAIVLVIIGIILGGILKGQEIITNAKVKRLVNDYKGYVAAIYTYQERYGVLPGDDPEATTRFPDCDTRNGDGDGRMDDEDGTDWGRYWTHLRCAGIISGSGNKHPTHPFGGRVYINYNDYNLSGHTICFTNVPGDIAAIIDSSNDDGNPSKGTIQGDGSATTYDPARSYNLCFRL
ncbi:prepilin-type N-terminal cleavage/methylation domain-containing protein [Thermodesulfatator atlanticus]|uniref:prepilin-type N-terminal cleavage/methylation domain-containing protein n=1 Tax=Thermodesulfatator atlanticus TaxID=501497 RepID=UPI0003B5D329|nr:prepilin-type N-terminal cleavage/methylation domain-containing protein [Thermodesulfatator atlanticus]